MLWKGEKMLGFILGSLIFDGPHYTYVSCADSERRQLESFIRFVQTVRQFFKKDDTTK